MLPSGATPPAVVPGEQRECPPGPDGGNWWASCPLTGGGAWRCRNGGPGAFPPGVVTDQRTSTPNQTGLSTHLTQGSIDTRVGSRERKRPTDGQRQTEGEIQSKAGRGGDRRRDPNPSHLTDLSGQLGPTPTIHPPTHPHPPPGLSRDLWDMVTHTQRLSQKAGPIPAPASGWQGCVNDFLVKRPQEMAFCGVRWLLRAFSRLFRYSHDRWHQAVSHILPTSSGGGHLYSQGQNVGTGSPLDWKC